MNLSFISFLIVASIVPSLRAEGVKEAIDNAKPALELVLATAGHHADSVRRRTVNKMKDVRDGYVQNDKSVHEQLRQAIQKLLASYRNNYDVISKNLQRNIEQLDNQIQPNFEESLANFKKSFSGQVKNDAGAEAHLKSVVGDLEERAKAVFAQSKAKLSTMGEELEKEYKQGLDSFTKS